MVYYAYFHSIMNYGLIFGENSSHSVKIFKIQNNIIFILIYRVVLSSQMRILPTTFNH
jgi:hypothetical protein